MTTAGYRKRTGQAGALLSVSGLLTAAALMLGMTSAGAVEFGNRNYLGKLSAQPPTGYPVSPAAIDLSKGPANLTVGVSVANLTQAGQTLDIQFSVHRIMTFKGQDVHDGQPGQAGISFPLGTASQTSQILYGARQTKTFTVPAGQARTDLSFATTIADCGYYQIDFSSPKPPYSYLASGFTRALGCSTAPVSTPTTVKPTNSTVQATTTTAQVLGEQVTQPAAALPAGQLPLTGSSSTRLFLAFAGLCLIVGVALLLASYRPSRS